MRGACAGVCSLAGSYNFRAGQKRISLCLNCNEKWQGSGANSENQNRNIVGTAALQGYFYKRGAGICGRA